MDTLISLVSIFVYVVGYLLMNIVYYIVAPAFVVWQLFSIYRHTFREVSKR